MRLAFLLLPHGFLLLVKLVEAFVVGRDRVHILIHNRGVVLVHQVGLRSTLVHVFLRILQRCRLLLQLGRHVLRNRLPLGQRFRFTRLFLRFVLGLRFGS